MTFDTTFRHSISQKQYENSAQYKLDVIGTVNPLIDYSYTICILNYTYPSQFVALIYIVVCI